MPGKPEILFIAVTPRQYTPASLNNYNPMQTFELIPHKHSVLALVAWLRENGCDGKYTWINRMDEEGISSIFRSIQLNRPDAVGFSLVTEEFLGHYELIKRIKAKYPDLPVIVGGPHVTHEPVHALQNFPLIDYVCIGEGEKTLTEWLRIIAGGGDHTVMRRVKGLAFNDPAYGVVVTEPREKIADVNDLPDPAFDLICEGQGHSTGKSAFPVIASYGCRYFCTFCSADHGNYRYMTPRRFVNQIQKAQEQYGVEYFAIRDSFWPPSSAWLNEFCDLVEARNLKIRFHFETRAGTLNQGQLARLKLIGAQAIAVGIESGDPEMLKSIRKAITLDMARETFRNLHLAGIPSVAFFIFGNQGENRESVERSVEFMHELNPTLLSLSTFRPLPGSEAMKFVKDEDKYWWMDGPYPSICEFSTDELHRMREDVHIRYPLRAEYLLQHVIGGKLPRDYRRMAWNSIKVHARKLVIGVSERYGPARYAIHATKRIVRCFGTMLGRYENGGA